MQQARRSRRAILAATTLAGVVALGAGVTAGADSGSGRSAESFWRTQPVQQEQTPAPDDGPRGSGHDCPERDGGGGSDDSGGGAGPGAAPAPTPAG